jgi:two-component system cell cycle sensor histidine kinase/response regulator CckA
MGVGVTGALLLAATDAWATTTTATSTAMASALAAIATGGLVALAGGYARSNTTRRAFERLFAGAGGQWALTDEAGLVSTLGPAALDAPLHEIAEIADLVATISPDSDAIVYRLLSATRENGFGAETVYTGDRATRVCVHAIGAGQLLWSIDEAPIAAIAEPAAAAMPTPAHARGAPSWPAASDIVESLPVSLARLDVDGRIVLVNAAARHLLGSAAKRGVLIGDIVEGLGRSMETRIAEALRGDSSGRAEIARGEADGHEIFLQVSLTRLRIDGEDALIAVFADATELKTLELNFMQSQKMQAMGDLAAGVAHDFNNLLTAISGHNDLILQRHQVGDPSYGDLIQIRQNANRAASLVRQLLAFSRKQTLRPEIVYLPDVLGEVSHLLNRLLGEKVTLRMENAPDLHPVKIDERQFEQVVMNLVVNARDAMVDGGTVTLRSYNCRVEVETKRDRAVMPRGDYVRLDIVDTGSGMSEEVQKKIFNPFFTTKKTGEGTGLGLSTAYGIIKQTGGFIFVNSVPNTGTTFSIYLPRCLEKKAPAVAPARAAPKLADQTGQGVVLIIEDEAPVRAFGARALKLRGYEVLEAASAEEALDLLDNPDLAVDVLISDVVMPGMDGPSCVREARRKRPDVRVIFVSGYAEESLRRSIDDLDNYVFLPKPFTLDDLTTTVKQCVNA